MKFIRGLLWQATSIRTLIESWLLASLLLFPLMPVLLNSPPLARSLYLVQLPLIYALMAGFRKEFFAGSRLSAVIKETVMALFLGASIWLLVVGTFRITGNWDAIRSSYAGVTGTWFFLLLAIPEYLVARMISWGLLHWRLLSRQRYAWTITNAILIGIIAISILLLVIVIGNLVIAVGHDIWGIPPEDPFAQAVFWLSVIILLAAVLFVTGLIILLPPAIIFSSFIARRVTSRIENLAVGTRSIRNGALSTRIPVQGEDEIAQLQADFNAMAADLEKTVLELECEKDKVWKLLENRRELVAGISHELRNPVATLLGYVENMQRDFESQSHQNLQQELAIIQYEATHLQVILNDLLAASQLDSDRLEIIPQQVDVGLLAGKVVDIFSTLAWKNKRVQVSCVPQPPGLIAIADPLRLEQIMVNLVQNAVQHTLAGGLVVINMQSINDRVCIEVEDTGEGISSADLPHLWEKFHPAGSSASAGQHGAGLGLSLVKELAEAMQGTVEVESQPGQGSIFRVYLPSAPQFPSET